MLDMRLLIFVVAYEAERHIIGTLSRIPHDALSQMDYQVHIIDDASADRTSDLVSNYIEDHPDLPMSLARNSNNQGYGGNQKLGYNYAIEHNYDVVVLLHGDGQYAPEYLPKMIQPFIDDAADMVLGSRMLNKRAALQGGMPLYKWLGNQVLTTTQNRLMKVRLAEWHTGYRAYRMDLLKSVDFASNSDYFDFDTDIIIQCIQANARIKEISIPTFYGDEISYVNGLKYGWKILKKTWLERKKG